MAFKTRPLQTSLLQISAFKGFRGFDDIKAAAEKGNMCFKCRQSPGMPTVKKIIQKYRSEGL